MKCKVCGKTNSKNLRKFKDAKYCSMRCRDIGMQGEGNQFYGKHHTTKTKKIMSTLKKGKSLSQAHKEKLQGSHTQTHWTGRKHTEATKILMSKERIGKSKPAGFSKKVSEGNHNRVIKDSTRSKQSKSMTRRIMNKEIKRMNTIPELKVKEYLLSKGLKEKSDFIHQYYVNDIPHKYVADFFLPKINTIIECDGDYFHAKDTSKEFIPRQQKQIETDYMRTKEMMKSGKIVLRFWETDIKKNFKIIENNLDKLLGVAYGI